MPPTASPKPVSPYAALAAGYDVVMSHVDYEMWASYILDLLAEHAPQTRSILELGCGTGTLALEMQHQADALFYSPTGFDYLASDASPEMIRVARTKAEMAGRAAGNLRFLVQSFVEFEVEQPVDAILLLYDGLNYLLEEAKVARLLEQVASALKPGGVAIIDQSTPANSLNNEDYFADEGQAEAFSFVRRSKYDHERRLHLTEFEMQIESEPFVEHHVQRAYSYHEVLDLIEGSPMAVEAAYDGFSTGPASEETERIHWVLRRVNPEDDA